MQKRRFKMEPWTIFAFELYYFEEKPLIDFKDIHKDYTVSFEDYSRSFN